MLWPTVRVFNVWNVSSITVNNQSDSPAVLSLMSVNRLSEDRNVSRLIYYNRDVVSSMLFSVKKSVGMQIDGSLLNGTKILSYRAILLMLDRPAE